MRFQKLTIENYKSFRLPTEIRFPVGDDGRNIFLIGGMNGAGKTSIMEAINFCLYGAKAVEIFSNINRHEKAKGNINVSFELVMEMDDLSELLAKRSWSAGSTIEDPKPKDLIERLLVMRDGNRVSVENQQISQDYIRLMIPPGITQFFFFDGEKIQDIAANDHSELRLRSSLESALGIQYIKRLASDLTNIKNEERKGFVEISDEDMDFKNSQLKKERSNLKRKEEQRKSLRQEVADFKGQLDEVRKRFIASFQTEPETIETMRENERRKIQARNRLAQVESEIRKLCETMLPFAIVGILFDPIRRQIEVERESSIGRAIKEHAAGLAKRIVRVVEEPEPIYQEKLPQNKMAELECRIYSLLKDGYDKSDVPRVLDLSERGAARLLNKMEVLERSNVFQIKPMVEQKKELEAQIRQFDDFMQTGMVTESDKEILDQLYVELEGFNTQIGRKSEQLRILEEEILGLEKSISDIQMEIEKLYEKHQTSKETSEFIRECDLIIGVLNQYIIRLRENKIRLLQEKTFEMYRILSSRGALIEDIIVDNKTYEIRIISKSGNEIKKSGLSAGEKEIFAVSLLWGLAQTSQLKLPIVIDTPLSRLDSAHRDNIVTNYFSKAGEQVIILSTDTEIDKHYYRTLKSQLSGAGILEFDQRQQLTTYREGYFWETGDR